MERPTYRNRHRVRYFTDECIGTGQPSARYCAKCTCTHCEEVKAERKSDPSYRLDWDYVDDLIHGRMVAPSSRLERRTAVLYLAREGRKTRDIAYRVQVTERTVMRIVKRLREEGQL